jgi:hypothetical protein
VAATGTPVTSSVTNHLQRVLRTSVAPESTQTVAFAWDTLGFTRTDSALTKTSFYNRGDVESLTVSYVLAPGPDAAVWGDDRVSAVEIRKVFRSGPVLWLSLYMTADSTAATGTTPGAAGVGGTIALADGHTFVLTGGSVDLESGDFSAVFTDHCDGTTTVLTIRRDKLP